MRWSTHQATSVLHGYPGSLSVPMPRIPSGVSHSLVPASGCQSGKVPKLLGRCKALTPERSRAVRVLMSRPNTAGSLGLCLSRPGLHIYPQLKFSRLQAALLLAGLPDGRSCLQTHFPLSFECLFLTVSSLCKKLLSWSEAVTLL